MNVLRMASSVGVGFVLLAGAGNPAGAITLPDNSSCSTTGSNGCFKISNTATSGTAVTGSVPGGVGVSGIATTGTGILGQATSGRGVWGIGSTTGTGVAGSSTSGYGVAGGTGTSGSGSAIFGDSAGSLTAWAGNFNGDVAGRDFFGNSFNPSDARLKKDIKNAPYGLKEVLKLRPVTYLWKQPEKHGNGVQVGLIAQEVQTIIPEVVKARSSDQDLALNYTALVPVLVKAVQEQQAMIQEQGREIAALRIERRASASFHSPGSSGIGVALAFGLLPLGLFMGRRLRRH